MDVSYWLPPSVTTSEMKSDVFDIVRQIGGDLIEQVQLIDEFENKKKQRISQCFRITYRSNERVLTKDEVNLIHKQIENELINACGVEIR
jgi:phenylalanyl-tRNA synthetase alpha chain